jgi:transcription elongation factor Elf1
MEKDIKLAPCPLCGGKPIFVHHSFDISYIRCSNCGLLLREKWGEYPEALEMNWNTRYDERFEEWKKKNIS